MKKDKRIVLTLDAGGTNFRFSAIRGAQVISEPLNLSAQAKTLDAVLDNIVFGFQGLINQLDQKVSAISFAFPGPADYEKGIIGDLENLPLFKGGVALGPFLENYFQLPVFINNDGDLFALGEAKAGLLPKINRALEKAANPKRYRNLLGLTFGTGFGGGIVSHERLFRGDNSAQAEINRIRNHLLPETSIEDSVSIRAVKRVYSREARIDIVDCPNPFEIFKIGKGLIKGNKMAALKAFQTLGIAAGNAVANAVTLTDSLVVIGGGLSGASELFLPALCAEMNRPFQNLQGNTIARMEVKTYNLETELDAFVKMELKRIKIPRSEETIPYDSKKKIGVGIAVLDTSEAVALGAYAFALQKLDESVRG